MSGPERPGAGHERVAEWDAAYVLGALSAADRHEFEEHLERCVVCRANVAELAGVPGLLARVPEAERDALLEDPAQEPAPTSLLPCLESAVRARRRRRLLAVGAVAAAAAAVLAGVTVPAVIAQFDERPVTVALEPVVDVPLEASVDLSGVAGGTRVDMTCTYEYVGGEGGDRSYDLVLRQRDGDEETVSMWTTDEGSVVEISATVGTDRDDIASLEVRETGSGTVLLAGEVD
ncbi:anti-sigma factor family protein [Herbiconiux sp. SYSU D00978]|uniref:anti-sigma factor family protein n=1 Tax=Herbiconiux sp. SYSU D00978 TaxID=2812562 RepID=UPI001A97908C|nr:zf-HC2 domain-containing protein [Herbiconiux sp. SYSU D00978]